MREAALHPPLCRHVARQLLVTSYVPARPVTELEPPPQFSSYVRLAIPTPLVESRPAITFGAAFAPPGQIVRPVRYIAVFPFSEVLENPPTGVCCWRSMPFSTGVKGETASISIANNFPALTT